MITGIVTPGREATVELSLVAADGLQQDVAAIVDTGYTGFLTLPSVVISALGFRFRGRAQVILGDGSVTLAEVFTGIVIWHGQPRIIEVDAAETDPPIGMTLLSGSELRVQVVDGGSVTIEALP